MLVSRRQVAVVDLSTQTVAVALVASFGCDRDGGSDSGGVVLIRQRQVAAVLDLSTETAAVGVVTSC